jgi:hypothetical protein
MVTCRSLRQLCGSGRGPTSLDRVGDGAEEGRELAEFRERD